MMRRHNRGDSSQGGFSLLEVMVATAFLALTLTAIFGAEVGATKTIFLARKTTVATFLARCKMAEIEEMIAEEGFPGEDIRTDTDECCEEGEVDGFTCKWTIEVAPLDAMMDDDVLGGDVLGGEGGDGEGSSAIEALTGGATAEDILAGSTAMPSDDIVGGMATQFVWPVLAPSFVDQVRKVTVEVMWQEGLDTASFDVVQFVVREPSGGGLGGVTPGDAPPPGDDGP